MKTTIQLFALMVAILCASCAVEPKFLTADAVEEHLKALGYKIPDAGMQMEFVVSGGGVLDGVVSFRPIPRPFGLPQKSTGNRFVQHDYDCEHPKTGAKIAVKVESGRFIFFGSKSDVDTKAIVALLERVDRKLVAKRDELLKKLSEMKPETDAQRISETVNGVEICVTTKGVFIASPERPTITKSAGEEFGL